MIEWSENDANNVDASNEDDDLAAMNKDNQEQDCDNDLSQRVNLSYHISHCPQKGLGKCSTISPKSLPITDIDKLKCTPQVSNVKNVKSYKIQYFQVDHPRVYY